MRDKIKKAICVAAAAALAVTALAGCGGSYSTDVPGEDIFQGDVTSNGGFVVEKGNYIYFINGAEEYTASNEYGEVVKGALMRISRTDLLAGNYENVVTVVPAASAEAAATNRQTNAIKPEILLRIAKNLLEL